MKLRSQLLTVSLVTLLVPWAGWVLVQELEAFLRDGQESALLASARTVSVALPESARQELAERAQGALSLRELPAAPQLDGYADDWNGAGQFMSFQSGDGQLTLSVLAGVRSGQVYLHLAVNDATPQRAALPSAAPADGLAVYLRTARGLLGFRIETAAPGALVLDSLGDAGGQLRGYWHDTPGGYQVELALPRLNEATDISLGAVDVEPSRLGRRVAREAGTLENGQPQRWLRIAPPPPGLDQWLSSVTQPGARAWLVDGEGWVMARSAPGAQPEGRQLTWAERILYRAVAGSRTELQASRPDDLVRFDGAFIDSALGGSVARAWEQDPENAVVRNTVALPLTGDGEVRGALVMEAATDGLLLVTNRALGRIMLTTLLLTLAVAAALWFFATRLSHRVQRLSGAVSEAMDEAGQPRPLPLTGDADELGELARNNARLLRAVSEYTQYLQKLAGRLSHELKTPLAITRSSLDNLATQPLDAESRRYLERAREGLERQAAIVRAMSEASRLEAAIGASEWETLDLRDVVRHCVEAYREVHPKRRIELALPAEPCRLNCAPDLLAQALDKLVDNAVTLTGEDERVEVSLRARPESLDIRVFNSGTQLPDVLPEQLFDSLVSLRERGGGRHLGLGLHIVRLVAEAHGGRATARNLEDGSGVAFSLQLPHSA